MGEMTGGKAYSASCEMSSFKPPVCTLYIAGRVKFVYGSTWEDCFAEIESIMNKAEHQPPPDEE